MDFKIKKKVSVGLDEVKREFPIFAYVKRLMTKILSISKNIEPSNALVITESINAHSDEHEGFSFVIQDAKSPVGKIHAMAFTYGSRLEVHLENDDLAKKIIMENPLLPEDERFQVSIQGSYKL